jgi:hypothetical protein
MARPVRRCKSGNRTSIARGLSEVITTKAQLRCGHRLSWAFVVERMTGIEPAFSAWEADVLPLNYIRSALMQE